MKKNKFYISRDTMLKIISVIFAILLWSYVLSVIDPERTKTYRSIEVRLENLSELKSHNLSIISPKESFVDLTFRGRQSAISKLKREDISASVDLSGYDFGEYKIPVKVFIDKNNITLDSKDPSFISFKIDENIEREMTVNIKTKGALKDGFVLGQVKTIDNVKVFGAKSVLDSIERLVCIVDVSDKDESVVLSSDIKAYDKDDNVIKGLTTDPVGLNVEVPILKTQTVPVVLNVIGNYLEGLETTSFSVEPNTVSIKGNSALINKIKQIYTKPISIERIREGQTIVDIDLPEGVSLVDKDVNFIVSPNPVSTSEENFVFETKDISFLKLDDKLKAKISDESQKIHLRIASIDQEFKEVIKRDEIKLELDLSNLEEGEHEVKLNIIIPEEYRLLNVDPESVKVNLIRK